MVNHGAEAPATKNFDDIHRETMDSIAEEFGLGVFTDEDRRQVWWDTMHNLDCWSDFSATLPKLREKYLCVSFTILSFRIIMDTARRNGLSWDAVISCEAIGKYKILPESHSGCVPSSYNSTRAKSVWSRAITLIWTPPKRPVTTPLSFDAQRNGALPVRLTPCQARTMTLSPTPFLS